MTNNEEQQFKIPDRYYWLYLIGFEGKGSQSWSSK